MTDQEIIRRIKQAEQDAGCFPIFLIMMTFLMLWAVVYTTDKIDERLDARLDRIEEVLKLEPILEKEDG